MLVSLFGIVGTSTLSTLVSRGHQFLVSDSPSDSKTLEALDECRASYAVSKAAWRTLDHSLSKIGQRVGNGGRLEEYNTNGGFVRDALMIEKADAVIVGEGVSPGRLALIDRQAAEHDRPVRTAVPVRAILDRETAEAELDACLQPPAEPPAEPSRGRGRKRQPTV